MGDISPVTSGDGFDIGKFVDTAEELWRKLRPVVMVWRFLAYVARWESTFVSSIALCILQAFCWWPVYFPLLFGMLFSAIFLHGFYMESMGARMYPNSRDYVDAQRLVDHTDDQVLSDQLQRTQLHSEQLQKYRSWLGIIQKWAELAVSHLDTVYSIVRWEDTWKSAKWLLWGVVLFLLLLFVPVHWILSILLWTVSLSTVSLSNANFVIVLKRQQERYQCWRRKRKVSNSSLQETESDEESAETVHQSSEESSLQVEVSEAHSVDGTAADGNAFSDDDFEDFDEDNISLSTSAPQRNTMVSRWKELRQRRKLNKQTHCAKCDVSLSSILRKKHYCRNCGQDFCSNCCCDEVPRSVLGATAPVAKLETVRICRDCYTRLLPPSQ